MKSLLPISVILFIGIGIRVVKQVGRSRHLTISQHVAQSRQAQIWFGVVVSVATILMSIFAFSWLLPHYTANLLAYVIFGLILLGFLIAGLIPQIKGTSREQIHNVAAWGMCFLIPVAMMIVLTWPLSEVARIINTIFLIATCTLLVLFFAVKKFRQDFLAFQSAYLGIFFAFLVVLAYL